jgi:hypothetical protein
LGRLESDLDLLQRARGLKQPIETTSTAFGILIDENRDESRLETLARATGLMPGAPRSEWGQVDTNELAGRFDQIRMNLNDYRLGQPDPSGPLSRWET